MQSATITYSMQKDNDLTLPYDPKQFQQLGYAVIDLLTHYLEEVTTVKSQTINVLPEHNPESLLKEWSLERISKRNNANIINTIEKIITESQHLHHPCYMGHQVTSPLPIAALADLVSAFLNNATGIFEMGPVGVAIERNIINWLCDKFKLPTAVCVSSYDT